ncbi:hypothetical protein OG225_33390 [Nocardia sp. NBC_01377]|uniref:hypothetical protein n=1 Tax=Nocardia sp. NBC_01377 TaxID=2903595 RepID=UPI003252DF22
MTGNRQQFDSVTSRTANEIGRLAAARAHDHAEDPVAAIDIRRYREDLRDTGFRTAEFTTVGSSTAMLLATK